MFINNDKCCKWAIFAKHEIEKNKQTISKNYKVLEEKYDFSRLTSPTPLNKIEIFEINNPNVSLYI